MTNSWVLTLDETDDNGNLLLTFPSDLLEMQGWKEGDTVEWIDNGNGTWILRKKDDY